MQPSLIDQGLNLMVFGMSTVFVFLTILVLATMLMSRLVTRLNTRNDIDAPANGASNQTCANKPSPQVLQAIKLAIAEHRKN